EHLRLPLYETSQHVLALSVCDWLGLPLRGGDLAAFSSDVAALFNDAAGPGHMKARHARRRLERWLTSLLQDSRDLKPPSGEAPSLFRSIATFRQADSGALLPPRIAAVELLNF